MFIQGFSHSFDEDITVVSVPSDFGVLPYKILMKNMSFYTNFSIESKKPSTSNNYFVDLDNGSNSNSGADWDNAFKTPEHASNQSGSKTIYIAGATRDYSRLESIVGNVNSDVNIIGVDRGNGFPVMTMFFENLTWSSDGDSWKATRSAMSGGRIFDATNLDDDGSYIELTLVSSEADVKSTPNSWYTDGSSVWVRTYDSRDVSANPDSLKLAWNANSFENNGDYVTYLENIKFHGGNWVVRIRNVSSSDRPELYAKNCEFSYCVTDNGLDLNGMHEVFLENCTASKNELDGFNHSERLSYIGRATELNCNAYSNGATSASSNNGSTMHDGGSILRINGNYRNNEGPNLHDVDDGTLSFNLNCRSQNSRAASSTSKVCYGIGSGGETGAGAKGWYIASQSFVGNQTYDLRVYSGNIANVSQNFTDTLNNGTINSSIRMF